RDVPTVCGSLREALGALEADHAFLTRGDVFPPDQRESYIELKWEEVYAFEHTPHPIEFLMYYSVCNQGHPAFWLRPACPTVASGTPRRGWPGQARPRGSRDGRHMPASISTAAPQKAGAYPQTTEKTGGWAPACAGVTSDPRYLFSAGLKSRA